MKRNVSILGTPVSSGNRGVLALGASLVALCSRKDPDTGINLLIGHNQSETVTFRVAGREKRVPVVICRRSPRSKPRDHLFWILGMAILYRLLPIDAVRRAIASQTPWIKALRESDLVGDVRGGDSFSDIYGFARFWEGSLLALTVLLVKRDLVLFPQTYGPFKSPLAQATARFIMRRSSTIIARDKESQRCAEALLPDGRQILLCPDVAFGLDSVLPGTVLWEPPVDGSMPSGSAIGLNVNGLMYNGGYTRSNMFGLELDYPEFLHKLAMKLLEVQSGGLWLVPHTFAPADNVESDNEACRRMRKGLPDDLQKRVRVLDSEYDQYEIKGIIGMCDFFIGSRMHSCIAALSQGIPCVGLAYSRKFRGVYESVGMEDWVVDGCKMDTDTAVARVLELYELRDPVREPLGRRANQAREELHQVFDRLLQDPSGEYDAPVNQALPSES